MAIRELARTMLTQERVLAQREEAIALGHAAEKVGLAASDALNRNWRQRLH